MTGQLVRRCVLVLLAALSFALAVGLLAWGPIRLEASVHQYADPHVRVGFPHAANVLANLPIALAGAWGWIATRRSRWPREVRLPWQAFHACVVAGGLTAALYHLRPGDGGYVAAQLALSAAFVMLTFGALAERVTSRLGSPWGMKLAAILVCGALALVAGDAVTRSPIDLRPLIVLQVLPVLLVPAGAVTLPGPCTRSTDWLAMLSIYAGGRLLDFVDLAVLRWTGWIGGHTLMHLCLAGAVGWLAYRAARAPALEAAEVDSSSRSVSLTTAS